MSRIATLIVLGYCFLILGGCASLSKPRVPATLDHRLKDVLYSQTEFIKDRTAYYTAMGQAASSTAPNRFDAARAQRDAIIFKIKSDVDAYYHDYELLINNRRAAADIAGDILELSLSAATTITNGERAKTVLSTILSFVQGSRLSINENFFREKTTPAIIAQMRANRTAVKNEILRKLELDPMDYSLDEALSEVNDYFYEGTLVAGIIALTNQAGAEANARNVETAQINAARIDIRSGEDSSKIRQINRKFFELQKNRDFKAARAALIALGDNESEVSALIDADVFPRLRNKLRQTSDLDKKAKALMPTSK